MASEDKNRHIQALVQRLRVRLGGDTISRRDAWDLTELARLAMGMAPRDSESPPEKDVEDAAPSISAAAQAGIRPVRDQRGQNHAAATYVPASMRLVEMPVLGRRLYRRWEPLPADSECATLEIRLQHGTRTRVVSTRLPASEADEKFAVAESALDGMPSWWARALVAELENAVLIASENMLGIKSERPLTGAEILVEIGRDPRAAELPTWLTGEAIDGMLAPLVKNRKKQAKTVVLAAIQANAARRT